MEADKLAAKVFCCGLSEATCAALQARLREHAERGNDTPPPTTRLGLALIGFTVSDEGSADEDEVAAAIERVTPLWTQEERERVATLFSP